MVKLKIVRKEPVVEQVKQDMSTGTGPAVQTIDVGKKAIAFKYYGLKINEDVLKEKKKTIIEVVADFGMTSYVVGRDQTLAEKGKPHYHIHFKDERTLEALQKHKQKVMPAWGHATKLYAPKAKVGDWLAWCGYAVKEQQVAKTDDIDQTLLAQEARVQQEFKKSQLKYGQQKEEKKMKEKDLKTTIYDRLDLECGHTIDLDGHIHTKFYNLCIAYTGVYFEIQQKLPNPSHTKYDVWNYMILRKYATFADYVSMTQK